MASSGMKKIVGAPRRRCRDGIYKNRGAPGLEKSAALCAAAAEITFKKIGGAPRRSCRDGAV